MLLTQSQLVGTPIMSLQTGTPLASIEKPIINPSNLKIIAFELEGPNLDAHPSLLLINDVREFSDMGMIVDSSDEFVGADDVIKLKPLYELHFSVIGKHVVDEGHKKIGKVTEYTIDADSFVIQQLNVKRPLLRSLNEAELLVHRSQIVEINDREIIIKSATTKKPARTKKDAKLEYVNPFRQSSPQPESIDTERN